MGEIRGFSKPVQAVFFPDVGDPVPDWLSPEHIVVDRENASDLESGCWVRNWRLLCLERGLILGD